MENDIKIKEFRDRARLTIEELSVLTGLDKTTISKHETGNRTPSANALTRYCRVFKCAEHELLGIKIPDNEEE